MDKVVNKNIVGNNIRQLRKKLGLNQKELLLGEYVESYLSRVENGQMQPSEDFLQFIAGRLGVSVEDLQVETAENAETKRAWREANELTLKSAEIEFAKRNFESAKNYLSQLDKEELEVELQIQYWYILGRIDFEESDYQTAELDLKEALKVCEATPNLDTLTIERVRLLLGLTYHRQNNHFAAIQQHLKCFNAINEGKILDRVFMMKLYYNLGNEYHFLGDTTQSLELYKMAVPLANQGENLRDLAGIYWGIGLNYRNQGNLAMAKLYLNKSSAIYEVLEELALEATVKGILGVALIERGEWDEAEKILNEAVSIACLSENAEALQNAYTNLAACYLSQQKDLLKAHELAELGLQAAEETKVKLLIGQSLAQLADIKIALGQTEKGLKIYDEAVKVMEQTESKEYLQKICIQFAQALTKTGQEKEALRMYEKAYKSKT